MKKKILFAASSGGHLEEILCLKDLKDCYDTILVTERTRYNVPAWQDKIYLLSQVNRREKMIFFKLFWISIVSLYILIKEKPNVVITTGVLSVVPICLIAKLLGKELIYIESFAKVETLTMSGRIMHRYADLFIVQWEELKSLYPTAVYGGSIF